jgi:hypothetical protein
VPGFLPVSYLLFGSELSTILYGCCASLLETKVLALTGNLEVSSRPARTLLNYYLLLLCIYTPARVLRGDGDHAFAHRQRGREVMECAIGGYHRDLAAIDHHPATHLGFSRYFNYMAVLD